MAADFWDLGGITVMLLCGFGCAWLGELVPQIVPVAKYVGAAYILYLAYRTLMRSPGAKKEDGPSGKPLSYVNGFLLQFLHGVALFCRFFETGYAFFVKLIL